MTASGAGSVLAVEHLHAELEARKDEATGILRDVSLRVAHGEVHGLVGESGAGKSMIAKAILGILPNAIRLSEGSIRFEGRELVGLSEKAYREILGRDISLIPQDPLSALNPARRIDAQMTDIMRFHMGWDRRQALARALTLLEEVHIRDAKSVLRRYPHELSGGMRQRILIATAFACEPKLIIADEPTTALDVTVQKQILLLLREMQRRHGTAILFVTHDLGVVAKVCGSLSVIHSGMIVEQGATADILTAPQHPFTRALFSATPRYDRPADALAPVPVDVVRALEAEGQAFDRRRRETLT